MGGDSSSGDGVGRGGGVWWDHPQLAQLQGANTCEFVHTDTSLTMEYSAGYN